MFLQVISFAAAGIAYYRFATRMTKLLSALVLALSLQPTSLAALEEQRDTAAHGRILFLGDSLTDGFGVSREESYPGLLAEKLKAAGLEYTVINAGVSGDTSAGGLRRIDWLLRAPIDVLVLALGANDGLRGLPLEQTYENLSAIVAKVREKNPNVRILLAGMLIPPNMGAEYEQEFRSLYPRLAKEERLVLMPFLLEGVAAVRSLNQEDGIHPTAEGHQRIAQNVWPYLLQTLPAQESQSAPESPSNPN